MGYACYKLHFKSAVHFGAGTPDSTNMTFRADTLFSALYMEALKTGDAGTLYRTVSDGTLLFSNAFPYCADQLYLPKPMLPVRGERESSVSERKKYKKLQYIPVSSWEDYLAGRIAVDGLRTEFGTMQSMTHAAVRREGDTVPYQIADFRFDPDCGLYLIVQYADEAAHRLLAELLEILSYAGIGGRRSAGLGRFDAEEIRMNRQLQVLLERRGGRVMLLSDALPGDEEPDDILDDAAYLLEKRSGFVASETYAEEWRKKRDLYVFCEGSCFDRPFAGDIYDVSDGGTHPVFRYAKGMFLGL